MRARPDGIPTSALPAVALEASKQFRDLLLTILGDDLVSLFVHGGTTFPDRPEVPGDLDLGVVIAQATQEERDPDRWYDDPGSRPARIAAAQQSVEGRHGRSIDATYLLLAEMGGHDRPGEAFFFQRRNNGWPVLRAHWLGGQYVVIHGPSPADFVVEPRPEDMRRALSREVEHLERHVYEGDASDPYEATFAVWNGCRVLYTLATGSAVISKRSAGTWGLTNLPARWHPAIRAAGRSYDGAATDEDRELLRVTMAPFVEMVRQSLPLARLRSPGQPPRWS